ncbi:GNAT family protein [Vibrio tapetis subsp. quintayensis]|uniref:GNAT family N-acetyltransferase n=1 Tax=Vibrio tapetis TaxID=52443 RepID=UPI0025B2FB77|nr:GNAT family protein [Vibrio tapetis]MDN3679688.1 GNAT family protein [Vibrio tapetis subsp. quintayensis]
MFKLETQRLIIRDMKAEDEAGFVAISQDAKYQRFYDEADCEPQKYRDLTQLFIEQAAQVPRESYQLAVELKESGEFIGTVCLRLEGDRQASMGAGLARHVQGNNLMPEAARALAEFGFNELNVHRIYAETIKENRAAIRLCKSLGMRQEAEFVEHRYFKDRWWNTIVLAVLKSEWCRADLVSKGK